MFKLLNIISLTLAAQHRSDTPDHQTEAKQEVFIVGGPGRRLVHDAVGVVVAAAIMGVHPPPTAALTAGVHVVVGGESSVLEDGQRVP